MKKALKDFEFTEPDDTERKQLCVRGMTKENIEFLHETVMIHGYRSLGELLNEIIDTIREHDEGRNSIRKKGGQAS